MSTIFGHGRLRLYLLKLLDESPRHGYEIISLLRDRFLGVYSPSPGTIYPRLARLEEEGLVTHEEVNGRKVYRLTDRGREELRNRSEDLDDLERELTDSVRDVARAVKEDVRDTIGSLREELKYASASGRRREGTTGGAGEESGAGTEQTGEEKAGKEGRGSWWERDWERFAQGLGGWGSWARREKAGERPEFERALHDFADRVRDVVREAGHVGESATQDLRRILDDTLEVIRRDMSDWGPTGCQQDDQEEKTEREGEGDRTAERGANDSTPKGPFAQPPASGDKPDTGDPWSTAVSEDQEQQRRDGTGSI